MHVTLEETVAVERSIYDCFQYLADFSTAEQWDPGTVRAEKISAGKPAVGSKFKLELAVAGLPLDMDYEITRLEQDKRIVLFGKGGPIEVTDTISFASRSDGGTDICYRADMRFKGLPQASLNAMRNSLDKLGKDAVAGIYEALSPSPVQKSVSLRTAIKNRLVLPAMADFTKRGYLNMADKSLSQNLDGKHIVITGVTSGLGLAAAQMLARMGAELTLIGRGREKMEAAKQQIIDFAGIEAEKLHLELAELSLVEDTLALADRLKATGYRYDVLINNAGALFGERACTEEGFERALAVNLLSPVALTEALMPSLADGARVINVVSGGLYLQGLPLNDLNYERGFYSGSKAYARAKRGLLAITQYWQEHAAERGISFHAMHPGWAATPGVAKSLPGFNKLLKASMRDSRMGADTMVWLAAAEGVGSAGGQFWLDRKPQLSSVIPGTRLGADGVKRLVDWLQHLPALDSLAPSH